MKAHTIEETRKSLYWDRVIIYIQIRDTSSQCAIELFTSEPEVWISEYLRGLPLRDLFSLQCMPEALFAREEVAITFGPRV